MHPHITFDLLAWVLAFLAGLLAAKLRKSNPDYPAMSLPPAYYAAVLASAVFGAYGFGSLNLILSGQTDGLGRSIVGALAGGIIGAEIYKKIAGLRGSTGLAFVAAFSTGVAIGRIGCYLSGLEDYTYGIETRLPWGVDLGDGISRHPVQIYESAVMGLFAVAFLLAIWRGKSWALRNGFYAMVFVYGAQRFIWEFLKPYDGLIGPLNLFHFVTAGLCVYAVIMTSKLRTQNGHN